MEAKGQRKKLKTERNTLFKLYTPLSGAETRSTKYRTYMKSTDNHSNAQNHRSHYVIIYNIINVIKNWHIITIKYIYSVVVTTYTSRQLTEKYTKVKREKGKYFKGNILIFLKVYFVSAAKDKRKSVSVSQPVRRTLYKSCVYFKL